MGIILTQEDSWKYWYNQPLVNWFHVPGSTGGSINTTPPGQNGHHFTDDIFRYIFVNENFCILMKISLKFVPKGSIYNNPALV